MLATATATATVALALTLALALAGARAAEAAALRAAWEGAGEPPPGAPAPAAPLLPPSAYVHELALAPGRPRHRRSPAPEPSVDPSEDVPTHWRPHNAPKAQFVTKQQPAPASPSTTYPSSDDAASARFNEIPLPDRSPLPAAYAYSRSRYDPAPPRPYARYDAPFTAPYGSRAGASAPQRRLVYYADLPDVVRPSQRAYDAPRDAYDAFGRRGGSDAFYRYRPHASDRSLPPPPAPSSYAILDAERAAPPPPPPPPYAPYPGDARYQRVPAPYVQRSALSAGPSPVPYNGGGTARLSVAPNRFSEPYRDYNPRQPAPWSMQVGTRLTVNDDERSPLGAGRRFYVQSQEQGAGAGAGYGPFAPLPPSRYSRLDDDPRRRL